MWAPLPPTPSSSWCRPVHRIKMKVDLIMERLSGQAAPPGVSGDFAFVVRPLPKIFLGYIFL